jgi:Holliday junction resolvase RusA-like endonuclease
MFSQEKMAFRQRVSPFFPLGPLDGPVKLDIHFMLGGRMNRDIDNMSKFVLDALEAVAYNNDAQVCDMHAIKSLVIAGTACTVVTVSQMAP